MSDTVRKQGNKEQAPEIAVTGEKLDLRKKWELLRWLPHQVFSRIKIKVSA